MTWSVQSTTADYQVHLKHCSFFILYNPFSSLLNKLQTGVSKIKYLPDYYSVRCKNWLHTDTQLYNTCVNLSEIQACYFGYYYNSWKIIFLYSCRQIHLSFMCHTGISMNILEKYPLKTHNRYLEGVLKLNMSSQSILLHLSAHQFLNENIIFK